MNFGWALERIKAGAGVRRDGWQEHVHLTMRSEVVDSGTVVICRPGDSVGVAGMGLDDIFATDWSEVDADAFQEAERMLAAAAQRLNPEPANEDEAVEGVPDEDDAVEAAQAERDKLAGLD